MIYRVSHRMCCIEPKAPSQNAVIPICLDWVTVAAEAASQALRDTRTGKLCRVDVGLSQRGLRNLSRHPDDAAGTHTLARKTKAAVGSDHTDFCRKSMSWAKVRNEQQSSDGKMSVLRQRQWDLFIHE